MFLTVYNLQLKLRTNMVFFEEPNHDNHEKAANNGEAGSNSLEHNDGVAFCFISIEQCTGC